MKANYPALAILASLGMTALLIWAFESPASRVGASGGARLPDPPGATVTPTATTLPRTPAYLPFVVGQPPPTATPTATPTETPTPTPTPTLGPPLFSDGFDDPTCKSWPVGEDGYATWGCVDGEYQIKLKSDGVWRVRTPALSLPANYRVEAVARQFSSNLVLTGLAFDLDPVSSNSFYLFRIDPDYAAYLLERYICTTNPAKCDWQTLIDWTFDPAINPPSWRNHLRVDRVGSDIWLYVNNVNVNRYVVVGPAVAGLDAGLYAESYDLPAEARFDDFRVYSLQ